MSAEHVYKKVEIVGSSRSSLQEAIENAVAEAARTLQNLRWFEVVETRGYIEEGKITYWQAAVKIGFSVQRVPSG